MAKTKLDRNQNSLLIVHMIRMVLEDNEGLELLEFKKN